MDNFYFNRVDLSEWFPGASGYVLQALEEDSNDLIAEIPITSDEFWDLPGDTFDVDDLEDEKILERILDQYSELQGD